MYVRPTPAVVCASLPPSPTLPHFRANRAALAFASDHIAPFRISNAGMYEANQLKSSSSRRPVNPENTWFTLKNSFRSVSRLENEAVLDRMQARLAKRPETLDQRRQAVEHPFGTIKQWMNQGAFLMRGLEKVRGEFSLTALAYNLRRVLNIVGFTELMTAVQD